MEGGLNEGGAYKDLSNDCSTSSSLSSLDKNRDGLKWQGLGGGGGGLLDNDWILVSPSSFDWKMMEMPILKIQLFTSRLRI